MSVVVVIPSRGRPAAAAAAVESLQRNSVMIATSIVVAVDADDPHVDEYQLPTWRGYFGPEVTIMRMGPDETGDLVRATNTVACRIAAADPTAIIGNLGDDHHARTVGWDAIVEGMLEHPGVVYGDDLIHGEHLPSAPFVSASIVNALGWYFLPVLEHMYVDDVWRELGRAAGVLRYAPDLVIEHMHPAVGKGDWDELYRRVNAEEAVFRDRARYQTWLRDGLARDVARIRSALKAAA